MKTLWLVDIRHFAAVLAGVAAVWFALGGFYFAVTLGEGLLSKWIGLGAILVLGIGLILNRFWPRRIAAALCLVAAVFLPIGFINPFAAMDVLPPAPTLTDTLSWMVPTIVSLVVIAWLLDPPRTKSREHRP